MHKLYPTLTDCICQLPSLKKISVHVVHHLFFVHFKPFAFFRLFFVVFDKILDPIFVCEKYSQPFHVLLQSRFQTPDLSIPVQQEAQEACSVGAGLWKGETAP